MNIYMNPIAQFIKSDAIESHQSHLLHFNRQHRPLQLRWRRKNKIGQDVVIVGLASEVTMMLGTRIHVFALAFSRMENSV